MTKKTQTGNLTNEIFTGESGSIWINEIYADAKNLKGNAVGGKDTINGGNDGAMNYLYGDAYSMEVNAKGGIDTITGGANGATNYIYGDAYSMKGKVQGGNDILVGGLNAKNFIYGDSFAMSNGAKAGDDAISMGSALSLSLAAVNVYFLNSATPNLTPTASASILNNTLIGDADNIVNSSSGSDSINIGNNSTTHIQDVILISNDGSDIKASSTVSLDISKNSLIGDAKNLKNSSSGNDVVGIGNNIESKLGKTTVGSYASNSKTSASSTVSINLSSNRLVGDAENIASSSAGYDSLSVGDNLKTTVGDVSTIVRGGFTSVSNILLNIKFLDNVLFGDADRIKNSSAGDDAISVGNNIQNTMANLVIIASGSDDLVNTSLPKISSNESADFTLSGNELIGDAATMESSAAGNDIIEIGNNFKNDLDTILIESYGKLPINASVSIYYKVSNNSLIGDTKNMIHSNSGADTIRVGNNLESIIRKIYVNSIGLGEAKILASVNYFLSENLLIGDALSLKNSSAGDDIFEVGNNFSNYLPLISNYVFNEKSSIFSLDSNFAVSNNSLIGDAENMRNSASGDDVISVGNAFNSLIGSINNTSYKANSLADTTVSLKYSVSDNRLTGDANIMQDSSGGNDRLVVSNDLNSLISLMYNYSNSFGSIESNVLLNFSFAENILFGDSENMSNSAGGHDTIELGNNFKNNLSKIVSEAYNQSSIQFLSKTKFSLSDNALYGDAKSISHASGGDDHIIVGNSIRNEIGDIKNFSNAESSTSIILESNFSLLNNFLFGDAKAMNHSQGGNDVISLGNDFVSSVGSIATTIYSSSTNTTIVSVSYTLKDNNLYGDAETMSYSKGGNDTLSMGVMIEGDSHLTLDIKNNTLYGDANTMKRSQGGDDKLTGADGEGSVTYLYGDAKFTDGKSGAGNDTLISGHGNDHMWGDFGSYLHRVNLHDDDHDSEHGDDDDDHDSEHDDDDDDHHDSEHEDDSPAIYVNYSTGKDIFVFGENNGNDTIYDFQRGLDKIDFRSLGGIDSIDDFTITSSLAQPSNSVIDFGNGNSITLVGVNDLSANDFMFAAVV